MKTRIITFIRNVLISVGVLLVLTLGGGAAYVWYMGEYGDDVAPTAISAPVEPVPRQVITPAKPSPDAPVSASVQMLTSPVHPGSNASITIKTTATAECTITVEYNKVPSTDSGLKAKIADEFGMVTWSWTVEPSVPLGTWPVDATCAFNDKTAMVRGNLVVEAEK